MILIRATDSDGDWTFGAGKNNYKSGNAAMAQLIRSRLLMFVADCFFDLEAGVDWFNLLGSKNQQALNFNIKSVIINTENVVSVQEVSQSYDSATRLYSPIYLVTTIFEGSINTGQLFLGSLLTELGEIITTESGEPIGA